MAAKIIDGKAVADQINQKVSTDAAALAEAGRKPHLTAVQVGENPASRMYIKMQTSNCASAGIEYQLTELPDGTSQDELIAKIQQLNADEKVTGMILQMPLPPQIDARAVQVHIAPSKDVEGMGPVNMGRLFYGGGIVAPCTPLAAVELLTQSCPDLSGKETVVVGHSEIVGKPIAMLLLQSLDASPTVTVCHVATKDLAAHTKRAEILFVAAGVSQARWLGYNRRRKAGEDVSPPDLSPLIEADMLREGAIVIDVAINRIPKGFDEAGEPVTVAMLLKNTVACAKAT